MDPNETLARIYALMADIRQPEWIEGAPTEDQLMDLAIELVENVEALDHWLRNGGFLPREWSELR